jgi:RNA polymerase sigma-70 factor, ECF subfamily
MISSILSETELIERARRFDMAALAEIYNRYSPGIYRYAMHLLGDPHQAEDCTADTFTCYLQTLRNGGGPQDHLQAYLYRGAHNRTADVYRRSSLPPLPLDDELPWRGTGPAEAAIERIEKAQVRAALARLTPEQRQVIVLKYLEGWENELVARVLGKPVGTVKSLQHRAINSLRRWLLPQKEEMYGSEK